MKRVFVASPFAGDVQENVAYARRCVADSLARGEAPFAPHLLYPDFLDDGKYEERETGIVAGLTWLRGAEEVVFYTDRGISLGMQNEIVAAQGARIPITFRSIANLES